MLKEIQQNPKWSKQSKQLKKAQLLFEFLDKVDRQIKIDAIDKNSTPSNIIREVLGLSLSEVKRPRVGVSMSDDELQLLAERYHLDPDDKKSIKRRATEEIQQYYNKKFDNSNTSSE